MGRGGLGIRGGRRNSVHGAAWRLPRTGLRTARTRKFVILHAHTLEGCGQQIRPPPPRDISGLTDVTVPASGSFFAYRLVDFFLLRPLRPVASATAPTAPDTALTAFRPTFLAVVPTPDAPRLLAPRFFAVEVRGAFEDFDRFLGDDLEPAAAPRDFLALRAGMFPSSNVCRGNSCTVTCCSSRLVA